MAALLFSQLAAAGDLISTAASINGYTQSLALVETLPHQPASVYHTDVVVTPDVTTVEDNSVTAKTEEKLSDAQTAMQAKAMAHLKTLMRNKKETATVQNVTPYQQLVKLAFKGKGVNGINSYEDAGAQFCKLARDNHDAKAQFALGWMYENGKGFSQDINTAAYFYHQAAAQNNMRAKKALIDFQGDESLATIPTCMLPDKIEPAAETIVATTQTELAPAGSNGNDFYKRGPIFKIVDRLAPQYHIETDLAMAFIKVESNFNAKATSPKNAQGLMQLIPATAKRFGVKNSYDPEQNIKGGLAYLRWLMAYFEGDVRLVAAAYNAGEGAVDKYKGVPPYRETKRYVTKIYNLYQKSYHPFKEDIPNARTSRIIRVSSNP